MVAAKAVDPSSGRVLEIVTTQPGIQFYSGSQIKKPIHGVGGVYHRAALRPDVPRHDHLQVLRTMARPGAARQGRSQSLVRSRMRYSRSIPPMYQNPQHATPSPSAKPRVLGVLSLITD
ncbi:MAG: hypothetical protein ACRD22_10455 [Terriglobia bacterium]